MFKSMKNSWFWNSVVKNRKIYYQIFLASIFINFFAVASAFYIMTVYDKVLPNSAFSSLIALTIGMLVVIVFDFIMKMLRAYFIDVAGQKLDDEVAEKVYDKITSHDISVLGASNGNTVNTIREFESFRDFFTSSSLVLFIDVPFMVFFIIILWSVGGMVALVPTLIAPLVILVSYLIQPNLKGLAEDELGSKSSKLSVLMEVLNGHETIRTVSGGGYLKDKWLNSVSKQNKTGTVAKVFGNFSTTFTSSGMQLSQTFIIFFGVYLIANTNLTTGALIACVILSGRTLTPLVQLGQIMTKFNSALAAFRSINVLMQQEDRDEQHKEDTIINISSGSMEINDFSYKHNDRLILSNINLKIADGEKIAILGPVGNGKTSLLKTLIGYYQSEPGHVKIDNTDINNIPSEMLREKIAYVPQTVQLFSGSIQDNIIAGLQDVNEAEVIEATKAINAHDFISNLPGGYGTELTEGGRNLSGGQRQKIALARAFLRNPLIAIFDEPTNSLDGDSENRLMQTIQEKYNDSTLIISTHKSGLLNLINRVIIVVNGSIVADGPKEQVLNQGQQNV